MKLFEWINSINAHKRVDWSTEPTNYDAFQINKYYSFFEDTIDVAEMMNSRHFLPKRMQYECVSRLIPKGKRFEKWMKAAEPEDLESVQELYALNPRKAQESLNIINLIDGELDSIKERVFKGGRQ